MTIKKLKRKYDLLRSSELRKLDRIKKCTNICYSKILGNQIKIVAPKIFPYLYKEIIQYNIYKFQSKQKSPKIIDCGANIGLQIIKWKEQYPNAKIIAFEPDEDNFSALKFNMDSFGLNDVELYSKAIWKENSVLNFESKNSTASYIKTSEINSSYQVETVRLREYLNEPCDLLKIDIEGAEVEVLEDNKDLLKSVKNIFVEYHSYKNENQQMGKVIHILENAGFRLYMVNASNIAKQPFMKINHKNNMDFLINIFGYRVYNE